MITANPHQILAHRTAAAHPQLAELRVQNYILHPSAADHRAVRVLALERMYQPLDTTLNVVIMLLS